MISIFLNLLRFVLGTILETVPCTLEENICSIAIGWNVLYMSFRSILSTVLFMSTDFLLILGLDDLSILGNGVLMSSAIAVLLSLSLLCSINICLISLVALIHYSFI